MRARGGTILAGRYRVLHLIAIGAMGSVWLAEHMVLKRKVAVKFHEDPGTGGSAELSLRRFRREARALSAVRHRNVKELFEVGQTASGEPYLILEHLEGRTLAERLGRERTMRIDAALHVAAEIGRGLEAVHAARLLHRDVKPENIFLHEHEGELVPKLLDFGLARPIDGTERLTQGGSAAGTPGYMAPEQARGALDLDARADVFALGVTLYEMLTGELPFTGRTDEELLQAAAAVEPIPLVARRPELAGPVADAIARALATDRRDRFSDARAMRLALAAALGMPAPRGRRALRRG